MHKLVSYGMKVIFIAVLVISTNPPSVFAGSQIPGLENLRASPQVSESAQLIPADINDGDQFGYAIAVSGDTLVVGSPGADPHAQDSGAAYVYQRGLSSNAEWLEVARLTPADPAIYDQFGWSVTIDGDTIAVSAFTKVPGGAAYIFTRDQGGPNSWGQVKKVVGNDTNWGDGFGVDVDLHGDYLVVGKYAGGDYSGSIYIFERNFGGPDSWGQIANFTSSDVYPYDYFGYSVAIDENTIIAGAPGKDGLTGAAYVFQPSGDGTDEWIEIARLTASDAAMQSYFGYDLDLSGDTAVIGAVGKKEFTGAAYVFERHLGGHDTWGESAILSQPKGVPGDRFGVAVSIDADKLIVGAYGDNEFTGSALVYFRSLTGLNLWEEHAQLFASDGAPEDGFGGSVCIGEQTAVTSATGYVPGGAAYVYTLENSPPQITAVQLSANPVPEGTPLSLEASVLDVDIDEALTSLINWGDGCTETLSLEGGPVTYTLHTTHTYQQAQCSIQ